MIFFKRITKNDKLKQDVFEQMLAMNVRNMFRLCRVCNFLIDCVDAVCKLESDRCLKGGNLCTCCKVNCNQKFVYANNFF